MQDDLMRNLISHNISEGCEIFHFSSISSTNEIARQMLGNKARMLITSDIQTDGVGKDLRKWDSPLGNIYASFVPAEKDVMAIEPTQITMAAAMAIGGVLTKLGVKIKYKDPNDILAASATSEEYYKIAGILAQNIMNERIIIGFGINLAAAPSITTNYPASSLLDLGYNISLEVIDIAKELSIKLIL